jgi:hypothetical protein
MPANVMPATVVSLSFSTVPFGWAATACIVARETSDRMGGRGKSPLSRSSRPW